MPLGISEPFAMILDVADMRIQPGKNAEFELAMAQALATVVSRASGFIAHKLQRGMESPERYLLMIWWHTLESHTVDFRQGTLFGEFRALVAPFFAVPTKIEHFTVACESRHPD
jgi:heme-degrading monooxygenase HmoA